MRRILAWGIGLVVVGLALDVYGVLAADQLGRNLGIGLLTLGFFVLYAWLRLR